jgi:hypothetical protein
VKHNRLFDPRLLDGGSGGGSGVSMFANGKILGATPVLGRHLRDLGDRFKDEGTGILPPAPCGGHHAIPSMNFDETRPPGSVGSPQVAVRHMR